MRIGGSIMFGSGLERELDGSHIASVTIDEGADGMIAPGAVLSAACRVDLVNDEGQWLDGGAMLGGQMLIGATLTLKIGAADGENTLWRNLGVFQVEGAVQIESGAVMRLNCSDGIASELGARFQDALDYPARLSQLWSAAVAQSRYIWNGTVPNGSAIVDQRPDWQGASLRSVMGMIAAAAGCFVHLDRSGALQLTGVVSDRVYLLGPDDYLRLERDNAYYGPVDALQLAPMGENAAEKMYYAGDEPSGLHVLRVENNVLFRSGAVHLDSLARGMLDRVEGYFTGKADFTWRGDPDLCVGMRVQLTDTAGNPFSGVIARQSLRYDRRFQADCSCLLPEKADSGVRRAVTPEGLLNAAALTGAVNGALLSAGSVTTNKLAAGSITAQKLAAGAVDAGAISAVTAKLSGLTAGDIQTDSLAAAFAAFTVICAGAAEFDRATVGHLVSQALNLSFGAADEAFIDNLRVSYAQMVSAAIGNLCIRASDGAYYAIDVDANGNVTAAPVQVSDDEIAAGQTASGRVMLETEITADSLNASSLLATYALVNRIDAARIDVDQLFAREAFIDRLNTTDISSNSYIRQTVTGEVERFARLDGDGLHVGESGSPGEVLIDSESVNVVMNGQKYSRFGANYVQFGRTQLRGASDGGMLFRVTEV